MPRGLGLLPWLALLTRGPFFPMDLVGVCFFLAIYGDGGATSVETFLMATLA